MTEATFSRSKASQLLLEGVEKAWRKYRSELKRCREEFSNEAIHDLRVTTRRLVAMIRLLRSIGPRPRLQKAILILKEQLDEFDDLRDTQVILAEISETIQELPELQEFQKRQRRLEDKLLHDLRKRVKKFNIKELSKRIRKLHDSIQTESDDSLESEILQAVDDAYSIALQRLAVVDLVRPATIHRLRLAFKTFRYMVEIMHPLLAKFPETNLKHMQDYQSLMGEVQDAEVFRQTFRDFSERASGSDLEAVHQYAGNRHTTAVTVFADNMMQLHSFWRGAPDKPFPWEKSQ